MTARGMYGTAGASRGGGGGAPGEGAQSGSSSGFISSGVPAGDTEHRRVGERQTTYEFLGGVAGTGEGVRWGGVDYPFAAVTTGADEWTERWLEAQRCGESITLGSNAGGNTLGSNAPASDSLGSNYPKTVHPVSLYEDDWDSGSVASSANGGDGLLPVNPRDTFYEEGAEVATPGGAARPDGGREGQGIPPPAVECARRGGGSTLPLLSIRVIVPRRSFARTPL